MGDEHFVVVVYDIAVSMKRRAKLHKRLQDFGIPVQYSVFECLVNSEQLAKMKSAVLRIVNKKKDHVRYYHICAGCQKKIEVIGRYEITAETPDVFVV